MPIFKFLCCKGYAAPLHSDLKGQNVETWIPDMLAAPWVHGASGALGGCASFLLALRRQHYKNNRYTSKLMIEILGGGLTAFFVIHLFSAESPQLLAVAFLLGASWAHLLQFTRAKLTSAVASILEERTPPGRR